MTVLHFGRIVEKGGEFLAKMPILRPNVYA